jgi:hypothetical protein
VAQVEREEGRQLPASSSGTPRRFCSQEQLKLLSKLNLSLLTRVLCVCVIVCVVFFNKRHCQMF